MIEKMFPSEYNSLFPLLAHSPHPPKQLYTRSSTPPSSFPPLYIAVVGSRHCTSYGIECCTTLIAGLQQYPVTLISGLAHGIDKAAHEAALRVGIPTIAFPGSGLDDSVLYPPSHYGLAQRIVMQGGMLCSEYAPTTKAARWTFPQRNRIIAGIASVVIVVEAANRSGSLGTAQLALEYNKLVAAVPGSIFSQYSQGTNKLLQEGAYPLTDIAYILEELHLTHHTKKESPTPHTLFSLSNEKEEALLRLLTIPRTKEFLIQKLKLSAQEAAIIFSSLELQGHIIDSMGTIQKIGTPFAK